MSTYFFSPRTPSTWALEQDSIYEDYTEEEIDAMEQQYLRDQQWREDEQHRELRMGLFYLMTYALLLRV